MVTRPAPRETKDKKTTSCELRHTASWENFAVFQQAVCSAKSNLRSSTTQLKPLSFISAEVLQEMIIWINTNTCSDAHLSYLNKFPCSQKPFYSVRGDQSPERKPEKTASPSSLVSLLSQSHLNTTHDHC